MANLEVNICGIKFKNPVLPAAGPPGWSGEMMVKCAEGGAGGIVAKTISVEAAQVPHPNMAEVRGGFLNTELWSELPPEDYIEREYAIARETGLPLIISLGYSAEDIANLAPRVKPFADALELSTHYIGDDPKPMMDAIRAAKDAVDVPVFPKLSPFRNMREAAEAAKEAGADGIAAINSFGPCLGIDINTGALVMGSKEGYGWLSGAALRPLAVRCIFDVANAVELPILGVGGVTCGEDAIELMMAGAACVQVCTTAILKGPKIFGKIAKQMDKWLDEHGYESVNDIVGLAVKKAHDREFRTHAVPPKYYEENCTGCKLCETSCVYDAIKVVDKKARLDEEKCWGCGLCVSRCKFGALGW